MSSRMLSKRIPAFVMAVIMALTMFAFTGLTGAGEVYAASLSKPSVTLKNATPTSIKVSWKKVSGASKYTVYRSTKKGSGYKSIKTTTSTSYTNSKLTCGKTYYYKVKAISGKKSATSSVVSKKAVPGTVSGFKVSYTCSTLKPYWSKQSGVSGYQVYYRASSSGSYKKLATTSSTSYTQKKLKLGTARYYKVRAYKKVGKTTYYGAFTSAVSKKTAHSPSTSWFVTKEATCSSTGTKRNKCKYCNKTYTATIAKDTTAHSFTSKTMPATNTYEAYTLYTCKLCGYQYKSSLKSHSYSDTVVSPTCTQQGYTIHTCKNCDYSYKDTYTDIIPHTYTTVTVAPNCKDEGYDINVCTACGYKDENSKTNFVSAIGGNHYLQRKTIAATCTTDGYTADICTICGYVDDTTKTDVVTALGHNYPEEYTTDETGFRHYICARCDNEKIDDTCYINLTDRSISVPGAAEFGKSATNNTDKLDINPGITTFYEITGEAENLTIDVNATVDTEVKLAGAVITNTDMDCIDIKDKSEDESLQSTETEIIEDIIPCVSVSAKDLTESTLTVSGSGNAIENGCELELKGHGKLALNSVSTALDCQAKLEIKNLTLDITSTGNRGIDTKKDNLNAAGLIISTDYSNITIKPNANITIKSYDDGIRCKNMTFDELDAAAGDTATVVNVVSETGDGLQLEGKKGITMYSGIMTLQGGKTGMNNKSGLKNIVAPAQLTANGITQ